MPTPPDSIIEPRPLHSPAAEEATSTPWDRLTLARSAVIQCSITEHEVLTELPRREKGYGYDHHDAARVSRQVARLDEARTLLDTAMAEARLCMTVYLHDVGMDLAYAPFLAAGQTEDQL